MGVPKYKELPQNIENIELLLISWAPIIQRLTCKFRPDYEIERFAFRFLSDNALSYYLLFNICLVVPALPNQLPQATNWIRHPSDLETNLLIEMQAFK